MVKGVKISDLENRSGRNNLKLRGIPESLPSQDLLQYATDMFRVLLPDILTVN